MIRKKKSFLIIAFLIIMFLIHAQVFGAEDVGQVVALKGKALIERDTKKIDVVLKGKIYMKDTVETKEASRLKMLFRDDSILTLGEKSRVIVKDYLSAERGERGKSVYNLVDGKLRSLVGGNEFEIHTPTVVAAARGTYFIAWVSIEQGIPLSGIAVIEGIVELRNINPAIAGVVRLERGTMSKVFENKPPTPSTPTPSVLQKELLDATELQIVPEADKQPIMEEKSQVGVKTMQEQAVVPVKPPVTDQTAPLPKTPVDIIIPIPAE